MTDKAKPWGLRPEPRGEAIVALYPPATPHGRWRLGLGGDRDRRFFELSADQVQLLAHYLPLAMREVGLAPYASAEELPEEG
jgi:hypothetical protein